MLGKRAYSKADALAMQIESQLQEMSNGFKEAIDNLIKPFDSALIKLEEQNKKIEELEARLNKLESDEQ